MSYREDIIEKLKKKIDINIPIIFINDYDTVRINSIIKEAVGSDNIIEWNPASYLTDFGTLIPNDLTTDDKNISNEILQDLYHELFSRARMRKYKACKLLVLRDIHGYIDEPPIKSILALIAQRKLYDSGFDLTIILVSPIDNIPEELIPYVSYLEMGFPDDDEIRSIIYRHLYVNRISFEEELMDKTENEIDAYIKKYVDQNCEQEAKEVECLLPNFRGMMPFEIDRMVDMAMSRNGTLEEKDDKMILEHKRELVKKSGVLELMENEINIDEIGGLEKLKDYLRRKAEIRKNSKEAKENGVTLPKGIFLVGMPGCGKSITAQATASMFGELLLKLEMGSLMGSKVGESEKNLRKAIKIAEAAAPCVLWIDEIEKGFSGSKSDENAYLRRMFGYFLSWLQDNKSEVFVIATANNLETLPLELKRKGRFDDMFFIDLPNKKECKAIIELKVKKKLKELYRNRIIDDDLSETFTIKEDGKLVNYVSGGNKTNIHFCGADLEYIVNEAFEEMYIRRKLEEKRRTISNQEERMKIENEINRLCSEITDESLYIIAEKTKCISMASSEDFKKMQNISPMNIKNGDETSPYLSASD